MTKRIRSSINGKLLRLLRGEQGSYTLESTLVMPLLVLTVICFLLFGMYMYQKIVLYYAAGITAERAAFSWDNSKKEPKSGMAPAGSYDGLYWRIGEDRMLESVFGLASSGDGASAVSVPSELAGADKSELASYKLSRAAGWLSDVRPAFEGQADYTRGLLQRLVQVKLRQPVDLPALELLLGKREPKAIASANVVEPAEFIRSVDLARYYGTKLSSGVFASKDAGAVLATYKPKTSGGQP
ncbi:TadE/TadG family type IV pilus assembly protein [Paenibacillus thailandensis]|uniref:TadE/TadG family type IV pilus assembly protein n=1 Tax=Paenibacillus thailandensis TaxID=393250 RepID=A0ABW5QWQ5_9BACL